MYKIAKIYISVAKKCEEESSLMMDFMGILHKNGQILDNYSVVKHDDHYIATVTTTDDDSLEDRYNNIYVKQCLEKLSTSY